MGCCRLSQFENLKLKIQMNTPQPLPTKLTEGLFEADGYLKIKDYICRIKLKYRY